MNLIEIYNRTREQLALGEVQEKMDVKVTPEKSCSSVPPGAPTKEVPKEPARVDWGGVKCELFPCSD